MGFGRTGFRRPLEDFANAKAQSLKDSSSKVPKKRINGFEIDIQNSILLALRKNLIEYKERCYG